MWCVCGVCVCMCGVCVVCVCVWCVCVCVCLLRGASAEVCAEVYLSSLLYLLV